MEVIKGKLENQFKALKELCKTFLCDGLLLVLSNDTGIVFTLRLFNEGLITLNVEYLKLESDPENLTFSVSSN